MQHSHNACKRPAFGQSERTRDRAPHAASLREAQGARTGCGASHGRAS